ncbi:MAG TPA: glycogen-binding domain-containing protein [Verrucomicrobiae bacterium]|nr:glycogen-binding domain-containing protein [Verrucomicrobiae bacterium]
MKTHQRWKESINEKIYFVNVLHDKFESRVGFANNDIKQVDFHCTAPGAKTVQLVGDFNHRHPILMEQREGECWFIQVWLFQGRYRYRFLVDGRPKLDPCATAAARDEHGEPVSVVDVN